MKPFATRSHEDMRDVLMDQSAQGPEIHYYMIRGGENKANITIWEPGKIGNEYIKAYGHYHVGNLEETYRILCGEGIIILQKRKVDDKGQPVDDEIEYFEAKKVKAGDSVFIPSGVGHSAINIGKTWLVTEDFSPINPKEKDEAKAPGHADYAPFKKLHGAAYYIIEGNGQPTLVKNPSYKTVPPASIS